MCWHKWSKWHDLTDHGSLYVHPDPDDLSKKLHRGMLLYQERICEKCGMKKLRCTTARSL
jgi:hypothetical protein